MDGEYQDELIFIPMESFAADRLETGEGMAVRKRDKKSRGTMRQSKGKTIRADACSTASVNPYQITEMP
jgi:FKBP-type peptidyl-prolyl cis-trans isomerase 2